MVTRPSPYPTSSVFTETRVYITAALIFSRHDIRALVKTTWLFFGGDNALTMSHIIRFHPSILLLCHYIRELDNVLFPDIIRAILFPPPYFINTVQRLLCLLCFPCRYQRLYHHVQSTVSILFQSYNDIHDLRHRPCDWLVYYLGLGEIKTSTTHMTCGNRDRKASTG